MTAVLLTKLGGPEVLSYRTDVPVPQPSPDQVLVQVGAAAVNNTDINTRIGWYSKNNKGSTSDAAHINDDSVCSTKQQGKDSTWKRQGMVFPRIQGADVAGKIVAVGTNVDLKRLGQRVIIDPCPKPPPGKPQEYFGSECDGGFAQFCLCWASAAHEIQMIANATTADSNNHNSSSSEWTDVQLATFPCSYSTAENILTRAQCTASDTVLVTGASGGVGSAVVQLAKRRGATVIALCGESKMAQVQALGADRVLERSANIVEELGAGDTPNRQGEQVSLVIDLVGGSTWPRLLDVLEPRGRYATSGAIAGPLVELDLRTLYLKDLTLFGCTALDEQVFDNLVCYLSRHEIKPIVATTYPLADIGQAQEDFLQKKHVGKLVLIPPPVADVCIGN